MRIPDYREDEESLEVVCPLTGSTEVIEVRFRSEEHERLEVVRCSRFGEEPVSCDRSCVR